MRQMNARINCAGGFRGVVLLVGLAGSLAAAPMLRLSSSAVGPYSIATGSNGALQTVEAWNAGDGSLSLQVSSSAAWAVPTIGAARACSTRLGTCLPIQVALQTASLAKGAYTGTITVGDPNAIDAPQTITVTAEIAATCPTNWCCTPRPAARPRPSSLRISTSTRRSRRRMGNPGWLWPQWCGQLQFRRDVHDQRGAAIRDGGRRYPWLDRCLRLELCAGQQNRGRATARDHFSDRRGLLAQSGFPHCPANLQTDANLGHRERRVGHAGGFGRDGRHRIGWKLAFGGEQRTAISVAADPSGLNVGVYQGSITVGTNAANGTLTIPVQLEVQPQSPPLATYRGTVNAATFLPNDPIAQGEIMALFGEQLAYDGPQSAVSTRSLRNLAIHAFW